MIRFYGKNKYPLILQGFFSSLREAREVLDITPKTDKTFLKDILLGYKIGEVYGPKVDQ